MKLRWLQIITDPVLETVALSQDWRFRCKERSLDQSPENVNFYSMSQRVKVNGQRTATSTKISITIWCDAVCYQQTGIDIVVASANLQDCLHQPLHLLWCVTSCPNTRDLIHSEQYQGMWICVHLCQGKDFEITMLYAKRGSTRVMVRKTCQGARTCKDA